MSDKATHFTGTVPENYDTGLGPHFFQEFGAELAARVAAEDPESVLELAAGTGIVTRALRNALPVDCRLVATDLNPPMLGVAAEKFENYEEVSFEEADAMSLPFDDGAFEAIACQFGVMFFPGKAESFAEAKRVLVEGGVYHFNVWDTWEGNPFGRICQDVAEKFFPDDPPQFYKMPFSYPDPDVIEADLKASGFSDISIETVNLEQEIDFPLLARGLIYGNPMFEEIQDRGGDPDEVMAAIEAVLRAEFGDPGVMPIRALFVRAA
ncbi:MAG: class I SAM-dependent methyltransferase [Sphingomonadales bacterium]